ncbi:MAG: 3-dehydroquinate synthase [Planctomycetota bacterium]|nr:MAG: 3-dehydroquinate synthase [Planctomycetota bacterium]
MNSNKVLKLKHYNRSDAYESCLSPSKPIYFGHNILHHLESHVATLNPDKVFIITDTNVAKLYGDTIKAQLLNRPNHLVTFNAGDQNKTLQTIETLAEKVLEAGCSKNSLILNLGGGLAMNLGGMLASLLYRGIRFIHVPTNFIGQTDVVLSNKQGVNTFGGKNLLGMYSSPEFSLVDTSFLQTESKRSKFAGIAESMKNALILKSDFYAYMKKVLKSSINDVDMHELAKKTFEQKLSICKRDPTEKQLGLSLEYGHTIGHAIEILSKGDLLHGEAVYIGMHISAEIALQLGIMNQSDFKEHQAFLKSIKISSKIPKSITMDKILIAIQKDNKKTGSQPAFILLKGLGELHQIGGQLQTMVPKKIIEDCIRPYLS